MLTTLIIADAIVLALLVVLLYLSLSRWHWVEPFERLHEIFSILCLYGAVASGAGLIVLGCVALLRFLDDFLRHLYGPS